MLMTVTGKRHSARAIAVALSIIAVTLIVGAGPALAQFGAGMRAPAIGGVAGWLLAKQAVFYTALASMLRAARSDGSAVWGLMGISFIYGVFHAAGPGHGKAVISSYLLANGETWRRGVILSFASALLQSFTAVGIVGIAAVLLGATAKIMGDTVRLIEIVSYGLIVLLGLRLLWVKGRGFLKALQALWTAPSRDAAMEELSHEEPAYECSHTHARAVDAEAFACEAAHASGVGDRSGHGHDHDHAHHHENDHCDDHDEPDVLPWGHAHGPEPQDLGGIGGWRRGLSAVVAVGMRPCSGAIIVLVFAMAQGLLWAGIASTLVMGLGTFITVATIASLAVGARTLAKRVAASPGGYGTVVMRGLETGAAALILAFGVLLLTGYMASERLGLF
jgi:nickel/cobalt transporter (NicO) family protein